MKTSLPRSLLIAAGLALGSLAASAAETPTDAVVLQITGGTATAMVQGSTPRQIKNGDKLQEGTTITTGPGATVQLQPFSGSVSSISENTTVVLDKLSDETNGPGAATMHHAKLNLKSGNVVSMLDPATKTSHDYGVITPRGVAAANGTSSTANVDPSTTVTTISANADSVTFTASDGTAYTIINGSVLVTPPGGGTPTTFTVAQLGAIPAGTATGLQAKALAAIQSGVQGMVAVLNSPTASNSLNGAGGSAASLAATVIAVSNSVNPTGAAANTASIVAAVSTSASSVGNSSAVAAVMAAAVQAAPTQAATIASSVAAQVVTANATNPAATTAALQAVTQGADVGAGGASASTTTIATIAANVAAASTTNAQAVINASNTVAPGAASAVNASVVASTNLTPTQIANQAPPAPPAPPTVPSPIIVQGTTPPTFPTQPAPIQSVSVPST